MDVVLAAVDGYGCTSPLSKPVPIAHWAASTKGVQFSNQPCFELVSAI